MLKHVRWLRRRRLFRQERGATLVEVVIAIVVLGLIVASVPTAIIEVNNFQSRQRELRIAENLARTEFEYIKSQPYIPGPLMLTFPSPYLGQTKMQAEEFRLGGTYFVKNEVYFVNPDTLESFLATPESVGNESGIQKIVVKVWGVRGSENNYQPLYETIDYKTNHMTG